MHANICIKLFLLIRLKLKYILCRFFRIYTQVLFAWVTFTITKEIVKCLHFTLGCFRTKGCLLRAHIWFSFFFFFFITDAFMVSLCCSSYITLIGIMCLQSLTLKASLICLKNLPVLTLNLSLAPVPAGMIYRSVVQYVTLCVMWKHTLTSD